MNKKVIILVMFSILLIIVPISIFFVTNKDGNKYNNSNSILQKSEIKNNGLEYRYLLENDMNSNEKKQVIEKLESNNARNVQIDGNLQLLCPEYTYYCVFGGYTNNFYSLHINKNHLLFPNKIGYITTGFYLVDSNLELQSIILSYGEGVTNPNFENKEVIERGNWKFIYNDDKGSFVGYYLLNRKFLMIESKDNNTKLTKEIATDLFDKISEAIEVNEEDIHILDEMANGNYTSSYITIEDKYSEITLDKENTLDLVTNVNVIHWYTQNNWPGNNIKLITKDFKNYITVIESINDYDLNEITDSSEHMELVPYKYNDTEIQLIYAKYDKDAVLEKANDVLLGFITKINNKSYTFIFDSSKDKLIYKGTNPKERIDYIYDTILKK